MFHESLTNDGFNSMGIPEDVIVQIKDSNRSFQDVSAAVLSIWVPESLIIDVNHHGEELTGYEADQLRGSALQNIFFPEDQERILLLVNSIQKTKHSNFNELREYSLSLRKRSKRRVYCDMGIRQSSLCNDVVILTLNDISLLKQKESELRNAHQYSQGILDSVNEMIIVIDNQAKVETANNSFALSFKLGDLRPEGYPVVKFFPNIDERELTYGCLPTLGIETTAVRPDGSSFPVLLTGSVLQHDQLRFRHTIIVATDITERKAREAQIAEQQMMLVQASKLTSLGEMASSIAHEIHNPLQILSGARELAEMILNSPGFNIDMLKENLQKIDLMTLRISRTIHGLETLSRDQSKDEMSPESLKKILDDTLSLCEQKIRKSVDQFSVVMPQHPIYLLCRSTQISQILLNLLNNACDAICESRPNWLSLSVLCSDEDPTITINVVDSGPGIPQEIAKKIFQPFFTTKGVGKGTGLGLSISKKIAESHGGALDLNTYSKHTCFVLKIPRIDNKVEDNSILKIASAI